MPTSSRSMITPSSREEMNDIAIADETECRWSDGNADQYFADHRWYPETLRQFGAEFRGDENDDKVEQDVGHRKRRCRFCSELSEHRSDLRALK